MVELVDTLGLGSNLFGGPGSSPGIDRLIIFKFNIIGYKRVSGSPSPTALVRGRLSTLEPTR